MTTKALTQKIIDYLENSYAMENANETIFTSLAATCNDRKLASLLSSGSQVSAEHKDILGQLLIVYSNGDSTRKTLQTNIAAMGKEAVDILRTDQTGKATRDAYIITTMGQISYELLKNLAEKEGLEEIITVADDLLDNHQQLQSKIEEFWQVAIKSDLEKMKDPNKKLFDYLEDVYAMEKNVFLMLSSVVASTKDEKLKQKVLAQRNKTSQQIEDLKYHLMRLGHHSSKRKIAQGYFFAIFKGPLNLFRTDAGGKDARDLLMVQSMQIAAYELLMHLAILTNNEKTTALAREFCMAERQFATWVEDHVKEFVEQDLEDFIQTTDQELPIVVYDDTCSLCNTSIGWVHRLDWRHQFNFMGYSKAAIKYPEVAKTDLDTGVQVRFPDQTTTVGINAVRSIMLQTPLGFIPGMLLFIPGIHFLANRVYKQIAANRPRTCPIPTHR